MKKISTLDWIVIILFVLGVGLYLFGTSGCKTPERLASRSERLWDKSYRLDKEVNANKCATVYNPKDSIHEKTTYKTGKTDSSTTTGTTTSIRHVHDTLNNTDTIYIENTIVVNHYYYRIDTAATEKYIQEVNNAKIAELQEHQKKELADKDAQLQKSKDANTILQNKIAGQKKTISWWRVIALCALGYTIGRWAISYFTKGRIKLP